jgi:hypothetical protein
MSAFCPLTRLGLYPNLSGRRLVARGTGLVVIALAIVWHPMRSRRAGTVGSNSGKWLASLAAVAFWVVWAANAMPAFWFLTVVVGLPLAVGASRLATSASACET